MDVNEILITIYTGDRDTNTYVATYIHQQLRGNPNYVDSNIVLNMDQDDKTIIYLDLDGMDKNYIPNIAIDWSGIVKIDITCSDTDIKDRVAKNIKEYYHDYPNIDNFDMIINDAYPFNIGITGNTPHIVFNLHDWIISKEA